MLEASWTLPSPGSVIRLMTSQTIQPRSSSMTCHFMGNAGIELPGNELMVRVIQVRISSRPWNWPYTCSM